MVVLRTGDLTLCVDARILLEYDEVPRRPRFAFDQHKIDILIACVRQSGQVFGSSPLRVALPDPADSPFLEVALAAQAESLVTGNQKHVPSECSCGVRVQSPSEFLDLYRRRSARRS